MQTACDPKDVRSKGADPKGPIRRGQTLHFAIIIYWGTRAGDSDDCRCRTDSSKADLRQLSQAQVAGRLVVWFQLRYVCANARLPGIQFPVGLGPMAEVTLDA